MQLAITFDPKRCVKCESCTVACLDENDLAGGLDTWRRVYALEEGKFPEVKVTFLSVACQHCVEPSCVKACPTGAVFKQDNGIVLVAKENCNGCQSCAIACPFGVPRFENDGTMAKCRLCAERVDNGMEPACVHVCPTKALRLGNIDEATKQMEEKALLQMLLRIPQMKQAK